MEEARSTLKALLNSEGSVTQHAWRTSVLIEALGKRQAEDITASITATTDAVTHLLNNLHSHQEEVAGLKKELSTALKRVSSSQRPPNLLQRLMKHKPLTPARALAAELPNLKRLGKKLDKVHSHLSLTVKQIQAQEPLLTEAGEGLLEVTAMGRELILECPQEVRLELLGRIEELSTLITVVTSQTEGVKQALTVAAIEDEDASLLLHHLENLEEATVRASAVIDDADTHEQSSILELLSILESRLSTKSTT